MNGYFEHGGPAPVTTPTPVTLPPLAILRINIDELKTLRNDMSNSPYSFALGHIINTLTWVETALKEEQDVAQTANLVSAEE